MLDQLLVQKKQKTDNFLFSHITPLIKLINSTKEQLQNSHLFQFIVEESDCTLILEQLKRQSNILSRLIENYEFQKQAQLNKQIFKRFIMYRLLNTFFIQTLIIGCDLMNLALINFSTTTMLEKEIEKIKAISFLGMLIGVSILKTYLDSRLLRISNLLLIRIKIILSYIIYTKSLRTLCKTSNAANLKINEKQNENDYVANINTLLTADINEISNLQYIINLGWQSLLLITCCLTYLYYKDPQAGFIVMITIVITSIMNVFSSYGMIVAGRRTLKFKDCRVGLTTDVIDGIKQIKFLSWEETFSQRIMKWRNKEFIMLSFSYIFDGILSIYWNNASYVLLCVYISTSVNNGKSLKDLNIFSLIAIFNGLTFPLGMLPWGVNMFLLARISWIRIKAFLNKQDIDQQNRLLLPYPAQLDATIQIENQIFDWPAEENQNSVQQTQIADSGQSNNQFRLTISKLDIGANTLNFIIGQIGSGKSALFDAILNEMSSNQIHQKQERSYSLTSAESLLSIDERIIIKGSIAFCSQNTWVQNDTIQANILFGKQFESNLYNQVIDVCQIYTDIMQFEKKDLHVIGPEGKNLSGGQKQRITLARALYQNADIYLLDDVFSSLDVHVADTIFQKAIIQYLIGKGKTVLLITSHYRYLRQVPQNVNQKIIYICDGIIEKNEEKIQSFIDNQVNNEQEQDENGTIETEIDQLIPTLENKSSSTYENTLFTINHEQVDSLEIRELGDITNSVYYTYFSSMGWILLFFFVLFNFAMQGAMSFIDFWLKSELNQQDTWMHWITQYFNNSIPQAFFYLIVIALCITFTRAIFYITCSLISAQRLFKRLNSSIIWSIMKFYDKTNSGKIVNRIQDDTFVIDDRLPWTFHVLLESLSRVIGLSIGLIILFPLLIVLLLFVIFLYYKLSKVYIKPNCELKRLRSANNSNTLQLVNETLSGLKIIRAFDKNQYFINNFESTLAKWILTDQCAVRSKNWFSVRLNLLSNLIVIFVVFLISTIILLDFQSLYISCALALTYSLVVLNSCFDVFNYYLDLESLIVSVERVNQYFSNKIEKIDQIIGEDELINVNELELIYKNKIVEHLESQQGDAIAFKNIFLSYDEPNQITKFALKDFTLSIKQGEKVAFVGRTGSGKTSILNVLFGLYPHQFGSIEINGKNTKHMSLRELRKEMSVVPQFGFLYNATVKDNLDPLGNVSKEEIENLFRETGFNLRGISDLQSGYNTDFMIQQNGANLSNGEKQVLNFMRIMLLNKSIVCLDEATSNMDPKTDQLLHDLLFKYVQNRTLLVITHRLENIAIYDKIVVMEQGQIVEYGSYTSIYNLIYSIKILIFHFSTFILYIYSMDYSCPICTDLPKDAVESLCCGNIMCQKCARDLKVCPMCREENLKVQVSKAIQRQINQTPVECQYCKKQSTFGEIDKHEDQCDKRSYKCQINGCQMKASKDIILQHFIVDHADVALKIIENKAAQQHQPAQNGQKTEFGVRVNSNKVNAKFGQIQKFYCGKRLEGKCFCCDGSCGPTNGCNCIACSELDLEFRNLPQKGYLFNKEGNIAKYENNLFYCGINCTLNKNCRACTALMNDRYKKFRI